MKQNMKHMSWVCAAVAVAVGCGQRPAPAPALLDGRGAKFGPPGNEEDQFRFMWGTDHGWLPGIPPLYGEMLDAGFNLQFVSSGERYDFENDRPATNQASAARLKTFLDRCHADGIGVCPRMNMTVNKTLREKFPRIRRDGSVNVRNLDASNPGAQERTRHAMADYARLLGHPAYRGVMIASEIRDSGHPSFTPAMREAYRAHSGHDIPEAVLACGADKEGRIPPHWRTLKDFPADRVVDDDHPVLDFYVWIWQKGDGWADLLTGMSEAVREAQGDRLFTVYDPSLRAPPLYGTSGDVDIISHWTYAYPEPYCISFNISEQISRARKARQGVFAMVQAIAYRSRVAPIGEHPANEPAWTRKFPNTRYPTTSPDMMREALWAVLSRKIDGFGVYGFNALWEAYDLIPRPVFAPTNTGCHCANHETRGALKQVLRDVAIPLGPLLRALPERAPTVAVVESYASLILGQRISWDCQGAFYEYGVAATAANLMPAALTEAEIRDFGIPDSVRVLIMPETDVLTRRCYERIAAFKARGGRILADEHLCPALTADGRLPKIVHAFPKGVSDHDAGGAATKASADVREQSMRSAAAELKRMVGGTPHVDASVVDIVVSARSYGTADYVFAINDKRTYGDYFGPWRRIKEKGLPNEGTVSVAREAGAVYDLVRHEAVPFTVRDGRTFIDVSYDTTDGRALLVTEKPLGKLRAKKCGSTVSVSSPDGGVMVPVRIDRHGRKPFYAVVAGSFSRDFGEDLSGTDVAVTNLADGQSVAAL